MKFSVLLCSLFVISVKSFPELHEKVSCGYSGCPSPNLDPNVLNVHLVPHSHNDLGWLKTVDQYYYGSNNNTHEECTPAVQVILDSVIRALLQNHKRRFAQVETAYFWKWWQEESQEVRNQVKHLVDNGQLEFTGGAWSMNDEAAVHYHSVIDQFTWGFRKLNDTLGKCARPKIGWQIDTFGHSRETASLFSQFGFDGLFIARLDWRDKSQRLITKTAEMLWQGSANLGKSSELFTSVLYNHYLAPSGFCFDLLCNDAPIVDNKKNPEYNAEERAEAFIRFLQKQGEYYKTNNVIVTMGNDFHYLDAKSYFSNLDKLIRAINDLQTNVTVFYSSPACYVKAVNEANTDLPTKTDDFFPYATDPHSYWNGYYTSRPTSKRFERMGNNILQVAKQLSALTGPDDSEHGLDPMREAMGIMQHHDAITGTARQHVADDYHRILSEAFEAIDLVAENKLRKLYQKNEGFKFHSCLQLNISQCDLTENKDNVQITVYNPLSRFVSHYVRIPVTLGSYEISFNGNAVPTQIVPIFEFILTTPGRFSEATHELIFRAESIPPLGFKLYQMKRLSSSLSNKIERISKKAINLSFYKNGRLKSMNFKNEEIPVLQNYLYYPAAVRNNEEFEDRSSGAYIFRPTPETKDAIPISNKIDTQKFDGSLVTEYHQIFNDWVGQVIRVYNKENYVEFNWIVGPIPIM